MKITQDHYTQLTAMLDAVLVRTGKTLTEIESMYIAEGLSEVRFRWDLFWGTDDITRSAWMADVYKYANDNHIDTALRRYVSLSPM